MFECEFLDGEEAIIPLRSFQLVHLFRLGHLGHEIFQAILFDLPGVLQHGVHGADSLLQATQQCWQAFRGARHRTRLSCSRAVQNRLRVHLVPSLPFPKHLAHPLPIRMRLAHHLLLLMHLAHHIKTKKLEVMGI